MMWADGCTLSLGVIGTMLVGTLWAPFSAAASRYLAAPAEPEADTVAVAQL